MSFDSCDLERRLLAQTLPGDRAVAFAYNASGVGGFGYGPLFVVRGAERTMSELSDTEKNVRPRPCPSRAFIVTVLYSHAGAADRRI